MRRKSLVRGAQVAIRMPNLLEAALSHRTLKVYQAWAGRYLRFCADAGLDPYTLQSVGVWLDSLAQGYKMSSIEQAAAAVRFLFRVSGRDNPFASEPLRLLLRALRRRLGAAQRQVRPLLPTQLASLRWDTGVKGVRDKALILTGFGAALRVSELCALRYEDIELTHEGVIITIRRSKTDQVGKGRQVAIPRTSSPVCPVRALEAYLAVRGRASGPLFQSLHKGRLTGRALDQRAVRYLIKDYTDRLGVDPSQFSTHSLRAGLATAAALAGAELDIIASQTGHRSMEVLQGYIRRSNLFQRNAAAWALKTQTL